MGIQPGFLLSPLLVAVVEDVVTEYTREGVLIDFFYPDYIVLMTNTIMGEGNKFRY